MKDLRDLKDLTILDVQPIVTQVLPRGLRRGPRALRLAGTCCRVWGFEFRGFPAMTAPRDRHRPYPPHPTHPTHPAPHIPAGTLKTAATPPHHCPPSSSFAGRLSFPQPISVRSLRESCREGCDEGLAHCAWRVPVAGFGGSSSGLGFPCYDCPTRPLPPLPTPPHPTHPAPHIPAGTLKNGGTPPRHCPPSPNRRGVVEFPTTNLCSLVTRVLQRGLRRGPRALRLAGTCFTARYEPRAGHGTRPANRAQYRNRV